MSLPRGHGWCGGSSGPDSPGFTLLELMIVVALLVVALSLVAPSMSSLLQDNRQVSAVYALRATLNLARSEALAQRRFVLVCGTDTAGTGCSGDVNWSRGYLAFVDLDGDGVLDTGELLHHEPLEATTVSITFDRPQIHFDTSGTSLAADGTLAAGTFVFCDQRGTASARALLIQPSGAVVSAVDSDDEGDIVDDIAGSDVSC